MQRLKKEITLVIASLMLSMFFAVSAGAVPGLINYQGRLRIMPSVPLRLPMPRLPGENWRTGL